MGPPESAVLWLERKALELGVDALEARVARLEQWMSQTRPRGQIVQEYVWWIVRALGCGAAQGGATASLVEDTGVTGVTNSCGKAALQFVVYSGSGSYAYHATATAAPRFAAGTVALPGSSPTTTPVDPTFYDCTGFETTWTDLTLGVASGYVCGGGAATAPYKTSLSVTDTKTGVSGAMTYVPPGSAPVSITSPAFTIPSSTFPQWYKTGTFSYSGCFGCPAAAGVPVLYLFQPNAGHPVLVQFGCVTAGATCPGAGNFLYGGNVLWSQTSYPVNSSSLQTFNFTIASVPSTLTCATAAGCVSITET